MALPLSYRLAGGKAADRPLYVAFSPFPSGLPIRTDTPERESYHVRPIDDRMKATVEPEKVRQSRSGLNPSE